MRFDSLNIPAFGPFTSCSFEFPCSKHDLHVIYGANEAGKSSLLRGIHNLLYGFPASTEDNFLHDYRKLRIGATVSDGDQRLTFMRKKGNVGTLLDEKQNTIDEGKLKAFCGSVSPEFFRHMFGLSTETLRSGAASLLSAKGELGALLFAASAGGSPIEAAIQKLQDEADKLFAGSGRRANTIVAAYNKVKDHEKESRALSISPSEWKKLNQEIEAAQKDFDHKDEQLNTHRTRLRRVENLLKAIPLIHEVKATNAELAKIALPQLSSDFPARVAKASSVLAEANALIDEYTSSLESKKLRLSEIKPFQSIVDDAPELDALHQAITQHLSDLEQVEIRKEELKQFHDAQSLQLQKLKLKDVEELAQLPEIEQESLVGIRQLAESIANLERERDQIERDLRGTDRGIARQNEKLNELAESELNETLRVLSVQVKEHNQNSKVAADWIEKREECSSMLHELTVQLGIPALSRDDAVMLQVPSLIVLEEYHKDETQLKEDLRIAHKELDDLRNSALETRFEIKAVSDEVTVVSEGDLLASRATRDEHWEQIAEKLQGKVGAAEGETESFATKISESDQIADTLRDHAETIGKVASLEHRLEILAEKEKQGNEIIARLEAKYEELNTRWREHSSFLPEREFLISELIAWRGDWDKYRTLASDLGALEKKLSVHQQSELQLQNELRTSLKQEDANYAVLSDRLNATLTEAESLNGERKAIRADIESLNASRAGYSDSLVHAEEGLAKGLCEWSECLADLELDEKLSRNVAVSTLEQRHAAHANNRKIMGCQREVESLVERIEKYTEQLEKYRSRHLPDSPVLDPANPELTEQRLAELLASARVQKTEFEALARDIEQVDETLKAKQKSTEAASVEIKKLVSEANLSSEDGLPDAVIQFESRAKLQQKLEVNKTTLTNLAGSLTLEALVEQADAEESDALHTEVQQLVEKIESLQTERDAARDVLNGVTDKRAVLERAKDDAAIAKQFAANALATVVTDSERFIRLQHSISFLKNQVEAYRKKSQGPMVDKTSEFFRTLTDGSFSGVGAQQDDDDANQINLVALRTDPTDPEAIPEELLTHALSEGTRDQLYLALRMAAIDIHLDHHAPMPLILDDVLMTFDESRSKAFFELMTTLSRKTQVIVFTHHRHTAKMAETFVPSDQILQLG